jgi:hypothetical protein
MFSHKFPSIIEGQYFYQYMYICSERQKLLFNKWQEERYPMLQQISLFIWIYLGHAAA